MSETWRDIPGYVGLYQASDQGRIRIHPETPRKKGLSFPGRVLQSKKQYGYSVVNLIDHDGVRHGHSINRLVAFAFHGEPPTPKHQAAHLDGDRQNNVPSNLCWATSKENHGHRAAHGTDPRGERSNSAKLTAPQVVMIRQAIASGRTQVAVAREFGVSNVQVRNIALRRSWSHVQ
jgi:hypothetical protein